MRALSTAAKSHVERGAAPSDANNGSAHDDLMADFDDDDEEEGKEENGNETKAEAAADTTVGAWMLSDDIDFSSHF